MPRKTRASYTPGYLRPLRHYELKISLCNIEPAIWRRFYVPSHITLDRLHDVIQIVMGWESRHLFSFFIGKHTYSERPETKQEGKEAGNYRLDDLIRKRGRTFEYLYDFGDGWEHVLEIEDLAEFEGMSEGTVHCAGGQRACPPEDIGGPPGYQEFLDALKDPNHPLRVDLIEQWWGDNPWDSELFDLRAVNQRLAAYRYWARTRFKPFWNWNHP